MKKLSYIYIVIFICFSCSNNRSEKAIYESIAIENDIELNSEVDDVEEGIERFSYEALSKQKLQEMYDLISLKNKHPEFSESIKNQLKAYTKDSIKLETGKEVFIKNLNLKEEVIQVSDSIQKMKLYYDLVSENVAKKDSIWITITTNAINFEQELVTTSKVKFSTIKK